VEVVIIYLVLQYFLAFVCNYTLLMTFGTTFTQRKNTVTISVHTNALRIEYSTHPHIMQFLHKKKTVNNQELSIPSECVITFCIHSWYRYSIQAAI